MTYEQFLESKRHVSQNFGIPVKWLPDGLFDFQKHVHPLQLDVIDRLTVLYSNPDEVVFTPFMGVGSEVYSPVSLGRKAIGVELKESYFKQAKLNLESVRSRFISKVQLSFI